MAIVFDLNNLYVRLPIWPEDTASVDFTAQRLILPGLVLPNQFTVTDNNITDGVSCEMDLPWGFYKITADIYDDSHTLLEEQLIIRRMIVMLLG